MRITAPCRLPSPGTSRYRNCRAGFPSTLSEPEPPFHGRETPSPSTISAPSLSTCQSSPVGCSGVMRYHAARIEGGVGPKRAPIGVPAPAHTGSAGGAISASAKVATHRISPRPAPSEVLSVKAVRRALGRDPKISAAKTTADPASNPSRNLIVRACAITEKQS